MAEIVYPPGCRPVTEDLGPDELIRRLKILAHTLQAMSQDEELHQQYVPLAMHLADEYFLNHPSKDVRLFIACCIADVLRVYAPDAPYKDSDQMKTIFLFLIKQLAGLKNSQDPAFKRHFYLLENLAYVKSFSMCFELEDTEEIFQALFEMMFKTINEEHTGKVKSFMLELLCPLIIESDNISNELLDIILINVVEPNKSHRKSAYQLAKELIAKCSDTLETYVLEFFNQVLILGKEDKNMQVCKKKYELIPELYRISPSVLISSLPQLECKLKSTLEAERLEIVSLLAQMFSEKGSHLAVHHPQLWAAFSGRFNDISAAIRTKCIQSLTHILLNQPDLRKDVTEIMKSRQHDADENVRCEVVAAIVSAAKKDFEAVSEGLLEFVKERTLDKKFKVRKEAMSGLAMIYKNYSNDLGDEVSWIKDKILHGYYMASVEDRLLVERLLNTCLVPYELPVEERMQKLYNLFGTVDEHASKAFVELQKLQLVVRRSVIEWLDLVRNPDTSDDELMNKVLQISRFLPDSTKAQKSIQKFTIEMRTNATLLQYMMKIAQTNVSCKECLDTISLVLSKLGQPAMTNPYYNTIKMLLERVGSVMIDNDAIRVLIGYVQDCLEGGDSIDEIGLDPTTAGEKGLRLLIVLLPIFGPHFLDSDILVLLTQLLELENEMVSPLILKIFNFLGKSLNEVAPEIVELLLPICKNFAETGAPKQAKQAIRCLSVIATDLHDTVFPEIIAQIKNALTPSSEHYRTSIVTLGHIAYNKPDQYEIQMKNIISRNIVKELLSKDNGERQANLDVEWCREDELPEETRRRLEGLKCMARWLLGLKTDVMSAQKTFRMLNAFLVTKGDLLQQGRLSKAEMGWLRLQAGCTMLKICELKSYSQQLTAEQYYNLSLLMMDEVKEVREIFGRKLHKGLGRGIPDKCLPLDFMGYYALVGKEQDNELKSALKTYMTTDIVKRRDYVKTLSLGNVEQVMDRLPEILPDYMLAYAVSTLTHDPEFTSHADVRQLKVVQQCLSFILEPLITKHESYCYGFYENLIERIKCHKDALRHEDDNTNFKLWAVCDLSMSVVNNKTTNFDIKQFSSEAYIPEKYYRQTEDLVSNEKNYLPEDFQLNTSHSKGKGHGGQLASDKPQRKSKRKQKEVEMESEETATEHAEEPEAKVPEPDNEVAEPPAKRVLRDRKKKMSDNNNN